MDLLATECLYHKYVQLILKLIVLENDLRSLVLLSVAPRHGLLMLT